LQGCRSRAGELFILPSLFFICNSTLSKKVKGASPPKGWFKTIIRRRYHDEYQYSSHTIFK
jgi:hypothetical protein